MQVPVFGQNPALAAVQSASAPATLAAAKPVAVAALPVEDEPVLPTSAPKTPVPPTDPSARAPMGFLEMARQIQNQNENAPRPAGHGPGLFGEDGFDFYDVLDVINPLQHIPVVSTLYRALTGDTIAAGPRMAGGALFGGVFGLMSAAVNAAIEEQTGHDIGEHVQMALLGGPEDEAEQEPVMFASADNKAGGSGDGATETMTASLDVPGSAHKLTPEQVAILNEYDDSAETAAAVMPAAGADPAPSGARDLSPEQEALLLRSLGLTAEEAEDAAAGAASTPELTGDAGPDEAEAETSAAPEAAVAPQAPANIEPLPRGQIGAGNADFALRMKQGLERYFAQPTPHNPNPPQIDQRW